MLLLEKEFAINTPIIERQNKDLIDANDERNDLIQLNTVLGDKLSETEISLKDSISEKSSLSVRIIKEREQFKVKLAEVGKEKNLLADSLESSHHQLEYLKSALSSKEDGFRDKVEQLINSQRAQMESEVSKATALLGKTYNNQIDGLRATLEQSHCAYQTLENEFRKGIIQERKKLEVTQNCLDELHQNFRLISAKHKEQSKVITDLVKLVKELKAKEEQMSNALLEKDHNFRVFIACVM